MPTGSQATPDGTPYIAMGTACPVHRPGADYQEIGSGSMIVLLNISILWVLGIILAAVGTVLWLLGSMDRAVGPRRHYW